MKGYNPKLFFGHKIKNVGSKNKEKERRIITMIIVGYLVLPE